jgi:hypothetical protein
MALNTLTVRIFGPVLILTGIGGFVIPAEYALMSGAPAYNWFHIAFGALGTGLGFATNDRACRAFTVGFGAIDLYQAVASLAGWWPAGLFAWQTGDDVAHWVIGAALVAIGLAARGPQRD